MKSNLLAAVTLMLITCGLMAFEIVRKAHFSLSGKGWLVLIVVSIAALLVLLVMHFSRT